MEQADKSVLTVKERVIAHALSVMEKATLNVKSVMERGIVRNAMVPES